MMAPSLKRFYWDACAWIALIQNEVIHVAGKPPERRGAMCRAVLEQAKSGKVEVFTSAFSLVEVCKEPAAGADIGADNLKDFFENEYIIVVELGRWAGEFGRNLMQAGYTKLTPTDASHLAAAAIADVDELHTFDDDLLRLDNQIDKPSGTKLRICKPWSGGKPLPLLDAATAKDAQIAKAEPEEKQTEPEQETLGDQDGAGGTVESVHGSGPINGERSGPDDIPPNAVESSQDAPHEGKLDDAVAPEKADGTVKARVITIDNLEVEPSEGDQPTAL